MTAAAPIVLHGSAHPELARAVAARLGAVPARCTIDRFPDGECSIRVEDDVRDRDVTILQPTARPVGDNLLELVLLSDACRRAGARRITAAIPYFGYARQDRRKRDGEPLGVRVICDLLARRFSRFVAIDLHSAAVETALDAPLEHLSATSALVAALRRQLRPDSVVVAPDLGAARLARRVGGELDLPVAIVHKARVSGTDVEVHGIVGEVRGRRAIIVDDMISTAGTIEAAARAVSAAGALPEPTIAVTHALLVGPAVERLNAVNPSLLLCTDTLPQTAELPFHREVVSVAALLADALSDGGNRREDEP